MRTYLKFIPFFLVCTNTFSAQLPLEFVVQPQVAAMVAGRDQTLSYVIRNNVRNQSLPLKSISIVNRGDSQPSNVVSIERTTCGKILAPNTTCSITVSIKNVRTGKLNRTLVINYNGRALLTSSIGMTVKQAAYTILVYIIGSDLESENGFATGSIKQMMQVGSTNNMNVVIETGGAKPKPGWTTVKRQLVVPQNLILLSDLGDINMGGSKTIQSFMEWGVTRFPADKYIIAYWDHGGGPNGGFGDSKNSVTIKNFKTATENVYASTKKKFEIIGFDACYLGNIETFAGIYPYSNYLIGSEDTEPGKSWQYTTFLNYVTKNPTAEGLSIGKVIIDGYTAQNVGSSTTLSIIASANMPNLLQKIKNFSQALAQDINSGWLQIARVRYKAPDYGTSVWDDESYDLVDLAEFAKAIFNANYFTGVTKQVAEELMLATNQAVKYVRNSSNRTASHGLTVYFPSIMSSYPFTGYATKVSGVFPAEYINLVQKYYAYYTNNQGALQVSLTNFGLNAGVYEVTLAGSSLYDQLYAGVGSNMCSVPTLGVVPCIRTLQNPEETNPGVSGQKDFNKMDNVDSWPKINGIPVMLIPNDTDPNTTDDGETFLVPVEDGYLSVVKKYNSQEYKVVGVQESAGSANTQSKIVPINPGDEFKLRVFAYDTNRWALHTVNQTIKEPFTISFEALPSTSEFDAFRFVVSDLTGRLTVTQSSQPY